MTMPYQLSSRRVIVFSALLLGILSTILDFGASLFRYEYLFTSRFRNHIFTEGYELLEKLFQDYDNDGPGVPIVADHEGGYAAAIVSLLAAEKVESLVSRCFRVVCKFLLDLFEVTT